MRRITLALFLGILMSACTSSVQGAELKIDSGLRELQAHGPFRARRPASHAGRTTQPGESIRPQATDQSATAEARIPCFVRGRVTRADLAAMGMRVGTEVPGVLSADLTWEEIRRLSTFPGIEQISLAHAARPMLDSSRVLIHADAVQGNTAGAGATPHYTGITGRGVVVGFVDTGIQWNHPDFKDANGVNRILYIWDQTDGNLPRPAGYDYGREWGQASFQSGTCTETDAEGHGTHVAGIAAGSGQATGNGRPAYRYIGIAPEASIISVKTDFYFNHIVDGVKYIFDKADALHKPAVVNLSLGSNYGPHNGTEPQDSVLNALSGPGHVVCVSAGNSGGDSIHAETSVAQGGSSQLTFQIYPYSPNWPNSQDDYVIIDSYYSMSDSISVSVRTPTGYQTPSVATGSAQGFETPTGQGHVLIDNGTGSNAGQDPVQPQPLHGQYNLVIELYDADSTKTPAAGTWTVIVSGTKIHAGGHVDLWMADFVLGSAGDLVPWRTGYNPFKTISSPSTAESTLCVAAYTSRITWPSHVGQTYFYNGNFPEGDIAYFSALGPTADGRQRPTIAAPGFGVISSRASNLPMDVYTVDDSVHMIDQGTSMSCPHATGVVALLLQGHPSATPTVVKTAIQHQATFDARTGTVPNTTWGYGKLNAMAVNDPSPVELFALEGEEGIEGFTLSWMVAEGSFFDGFVVERASTGDGPWTQLTSSALPAERRTFTDTPAPGIWYYRVAGLRGADRMYIGPYRAEVTAAPGVVLRLLAPVPNPFHESAMVSFMLPGTHSTAVELDVYDVSGQRVAALYHGLAQPGRHDITWDGTGPNHARAGSGLYFVRLKTDFGTRTQRLACFR